MWAWATIHPYLFVLLWALLCGALIGIAKVWKPVLVFGNRMDGNSGWLTFNAKRAKDKNDN